MFPASKYGPLHYRNLDNDKTVALQHSFGKFDSPMTLSVNSKHELLWWRNNIDSVFNHIATPPIKFKMHCDASNTGWGVKFLSFNTGGSWSLKEQVLHINLKEMLAIFYSLNTFKGYIKHSHVLIFSDNTTAVSVINHMGTSKSQDCNALAKSIWDFCQCEDIWLTISHIPGVDNVDADRESRKEYCDSNWKLNPELFQAACEFCEFSPDIDCFANRLNTQLSDYVSFKPDPFAKYIDAFTLNWTWFKPYIFPPFSVLGQVLRKIRDDKADVLLIAPVWPTKPWYNTFLDLLVGKAMFIPPHKSNLILPTKPGEVHPLRNLTLMAGRLSATNTSV